MQGISNKIVEKASRHVQQHARYMPDSPNKPYHVRYPQCGSRSFFSTDTWDLVEQLARHLNKLPEKEK